jgi:hypothetical protein
VVTVTNNLLPRGEDIPVVPADVVEYLGFIEKKLRQDIKDLNKHHSKSRAIKLARVFINRQRANENPLGDHVDKGTVISGSRPVCPDAILGGGSPHPWR